MEKDSVALDDAPVYPVARTSINLKSAETAAHDQQYVAGEIWCCKRSAWTHSRGDDR